MINWTNWRKKKNTLFQHIGFSYILDEFSFRLLQKIPLSTETRYRKFIFIRRFFVPSTVVNNIRIILHVIFIRGCCCLYANMFGSQLHGIIHKDNARTSLNKFPYAFLHTRKQKWLFLPRFYNRESGQDCNFHGHGTKCACTSERHNKNSILTPCNPLQKKLNYRNQLIRNSAIRAWENIYSTTLCEC